MVFKLYLNEVFFFFKKRSRHSHGISKEEYRLQKLTQNFSKPESEVITIPYFLLIMHLAEQSCTNGNLISGIILLFWSFFNSSTSSHTPAIHPKPCQAQAQLWAWMEYSWFFLNATLTWF